MVAKVTWTTHPYGVFVPPESPSHQQPISMAPSYPGFKGYIHASEPGAIYPVIRPDKGPVTGVVFEA